MGKVIGKNAKLDPLLPSRADYRFIKKVLTSTYGGKVEHVPEEFERVCEVFQKAGGSWAKLFLGSSKDTSLLKKILRVAYKKGYLTKSPEWK